MVARWPTRGTGGRPRPRPVGLLCRAAVQESVWLIRPSIGLLAPGSRPVARPGVAARRRRGQAVRRQRGSGFGPDWPARRLAQDQTEASPSPVVASHRRKGVGSQSGCIQSGRTRFLRPSARPGTPTSAACPPRRRPPGPAGRPAARGGGPASPRHRRPADRPRYRGREPRWPADPGRSSPPPTAAAGCPAAPQPMVSVTQGGAQPGQGTAGSHQPAAGLAAVQGLHGHRPLEDQPGGRLLVVAGAGAHHQRDPPCSPRKALTAATQLG